MIVSVVIFGCIYIDIFNLGVIFNIVGVLVLCPYCRVMSYSLMFAAYN